ncbi:MAG: hypothetical protein D3906_09970 [Candidatus Electrothrix sp. AUS1_2]|nr:hypothetical protein [Candidatus Electrothrix sp. AUS1_2]
MPTGIKRFLIKHRYLFRFLTRMRARARILYDPKSREEGKDGQLFPLKSMGISVIHLCACCAQLRESVAGQSFLCKEKLNGRNKKFCNLCSLFWNRNM